MTSAITKVRDWMQRLSGARSAIGELHALDAQLREEHAAAFRERDVITGAPPPREEILATMEAEIDGTAARWAEAHGRALVESLGPGLRLQKTGEFVQGHPRLPQILDLRFDFASLVGVAPDLVKVRLRAVIAATEYIVGPATAERRQHLAECDRRIAEIEKWHEELVETAATFAPGYPIRLAHLPAVQARLDQAAREAERERQRRAEHIAAEAAANETIEALRARQHAARAPSVENRLTRATAPPI